MLDIKENGVVVHYPRDPDVFQFDEEVSAHFDQMARRSIPQYEEAHRLHAALLAPLLPSRDLITIWDIGASRGHFFAAVCNQLQIDPYTCGEDKARFNFVAVDKSPFMLNALVEEMPWVRTVYGDALQLADLSVPADAICLFYILQFVREEADKLKLLRWAHRNLAIGGVLFLGQKEQVSETYDEMFSAEYYNFRMANGYSLAEIEAKTKALKNSMWPSTPAWLEDICYKAGFSDYVETTRWLQFSTSMCSKLKE